MSDRWIHTGALVLLGLTVASCGGGDSDETMSHRVLLEIDRMEGTSPVQIEQEIAGARISLAEMFAPAGIELRVVENQVDLPAQATLRLADLHGLMMASNSIQPDPNEWKVHLLVVTADEEDPSTLGIMFDFADLDVNDTPREAFAIFETPHRELQTAAEPELLLTTAHELAHVFNLHHTDWEGKGFQDSSSVEGYSLTNTVIWKLSDRSIAHLRSHSVREVQPGSGGVAFGVVQRSHLESHQGDPVESYEVADLRELNAARRSGGSRRISGTVSRVIRDPRSVLPSSHPLKLRIHSPKESYTMGEPVILTVELLNEGTGSQEIIPLLEPEYGFLGLHVRAPQATDFRPYHPPVLKEGRGKSRRALPSAEALYAEARIFFGADGWTFDQPGEYVILADFPSTESPGSPRVASDSLRIQIREPTTPASRRALELLRTPDQTRLGAQQGLFLYLEGGDHLTLGKERLERIVIETPAAPQTSAARLALGHAALRPTIDGQRSVVPEARLEEARGYLAGVENQALSPLAVMRVQGELARQLEIQGRGGDAEIIREEVIQSMEDTPAIQRMDRPEIRRRVQ